MGVVYGGVCYSPATRQKTATNCKPGAGCLLFLLFSSHNIALCDTIAYYSADVVGLSLLHADSLFFSDRKRSLDIMGEFRCCMSLFSADIATFL